MESVPPPVRFRLGQAVLVVKNPPAKAGNTRDSGPGLGSGSSPGEAHGNPPQHSRLESPTDRGAWRAAVQT